MTTRLPVVGSTAATTAFASARLDGPDGHLFLDGNAKITRGNGSFTAPAPNAFSLLQIADCPYHTPTCGKSCYVHNLEKAQPEVFAMYAHNSREIRRILKPDGKLTIPGALPGPQRVALWAMTMAGWILEHARGGFRWHVSGDIFSSTYAAWIAAVVAKSPSVEHWIYTRSFPLIGPLLAHENIAVNLSCDQDNYWLARRFYDNARKGAAARVRLAYMTVSVDEPLPDLPDESIIFPDYALRPRALPTLADSEWWQGLEPRQRAMVCPVDAHGKGEKRRCGPCDRCL